MAKEKKMTVQEGTEKQKRNHLTETFQKEYKYEGLILLILALLAIVLGLLILKGIQTDGKSGLTIAKGVFLIGDYPLVSAWILIVLGLFSVGLTIWPYYKPSIAEFRMVTWPSQKTMLSNCIDVFVYTIICGIFFFAADLLFDFIVKLL